MNLSSILHEFDAFVNQLRAKGVKVIVIQEEHGGPTLPDAIFPNNWFSTHIQASASSGSSPMISKETIDCLCLYPLAAPNRRLECSSLPVLPFLHSNYEILDEEHLESVDNFLEGTGSLVLDRVNRVAYAAESPRTSVTLVKKWCAMFGYQPVIFQAVDSNNVAIYHSNVMLSIGTRFVIVCREVIRGDWETIKHKLSAKGSRRIIEITEFQMRKFAGNVLEVLSQEKTSIIVVSQQAWNVLDKDDKGFLEQCGELIIPDIKSIETIGGGSCRCMMAEIFSRKLTS